MRSKRKNIVTLLICVLASSMNMPTIACAICTPKADCNAIGYTETSCETDYLACPFDNTKLKCMPCNSTYRYDCTGDNIVAGVGSTCNGKYIACSCIEGADFMQGNCICDTSCSIGSIVYSDRTCSTCIDTSKTPIAVVVNKNGNNKIILHIDIPNIRWSKSNTDITTMENLGTQELALTDMNGIENTLKIVEFWGDNADTDTNGAFYCYNIEPTGFENSINQWYMPSIGELYTYVYLNYGQIQSTFSRLGLTVEKPLRSSTEASSGACWRITPSTGELSTMGKWDTGYSNNICCMLNWQ